MAERLNPNKEFAAPAELKAIAGNMPRTYETEPYLRALNSLAEAAIRFNGSQLGRAIEASLLPTLDFTVGLFPAVAVTRDVTEFVTGRNFWTMQLLTMTERGIALAGVVTFGLTSTGYKVLAGIEHVIEIEREAAPAARVAQEVDETALALKDVGVDPNHFIETLKEDVQSARTVDDQALLLKTSLSDARTVVEEGKPFGRSKIGKTYYGNHMTGPITETKDIASFSGAKYTAIVPQAGEKFFRVQSEFGSYWSRVKSSSKIQLMSQSAIHPDWNRFDTMLELTIPEGMNVEFYEGTAANISGLELFRGQVRDGSFFVGGGNQVFVPKELRETLLPYITKSPFK